MKRNYFTSIGFVIGCVLFLQVGCQKQSAPPEKPDTALVMPKPTGLRRATGYGGLRPDESPQQTAALEKAEASPESNPAAAHSAVTSKPTPKITFEKVVYDFGVVEPAQKKTGEFKFTNTGDGLLKITKVDKCCGTVTKLSKKEYAPGESGTLTVEFHSSRRPGTMTRRLHIHSNDKEKPKVTLTIKAKITAIVDYEPKKINLLLKDKNAGCPEITITSLDKKPFSIKHFKSTGDCITADVNSLTESTKFALTPKVDIEKLQKNLNGLVEISLTHPDSSKITIAYNTLPKFKINPPVIIVFGAEPQKPVKRDVWILNNYGEDFEIESTSSKNDTIKVLSQERISNGYHLEVEITPPAAESKQKIFTDAFTMDIKGNEPLGITCRGFYTTDMKRSRR